MKPIMSIGILVILIFLSGCITESKDKDERDSGFVDVNITYPVRDVFRGYEGGYSIIMVEYYDGYSIRTVDNQRRFDGRVNSIIVRKSPNNDSYLHWYATNPLTSTHWREVGRPLYPRNKYVLYLADDLMCTGIKTHIPHSEQAGYESFIK